MKLFRFVVLAGAIALMTHAGNANAQGFVGGAGDLGGGGGLAPSLGDFGGHPGENVGMNPAIGMPGLNVGSPGGPPFGTYGTPLPPSPGDGRSLLRSHSRNTTDSQSSSTPQAPAGN